MHAFWQWATVVGLSATPALVLGQSVACGSAQEFRFSPWIAIPVIALSGFVEAMVVAWLGGASTRIGFINRWCERMRNKPRAMKFAEKWGPWGGMTLGVAAVGQEPILLALRWLGIETRRLWLPALVSNVLFAIAYWEVVALGLDWMSL